jgi:hypothetical protein
MVAAQEQCQGEKTTGIVAVTKAIRLARCGTRLLFPQPRLRPRQEGVALRFQLEKQGKIRLAATARRPGLIVGTTDRALHSELLSKAELRRTR